MMLRTETPVEQFDRLVLEGIIQLTETASTWHCWVCGTDQPSSPTGEAGPTRKWFDEQVRAICAHTTTCDRTTHPERYPQG